LLFIVWFEQLLIIQTLLQDANLPSSFSYLVAAGAGIHLPFSDEFPSLTSDWSISPPAVVSSLRI